ncbi:MAG: histone deacetylase family protein [Pseudomonadota bacterium]
MATLFLTHEDCLGHVNPDGHPEQVSRLEMIWAALEDPKFDDLVREEARLGTEDQILTTHPARYLERVKSIAPTGDQTAFIDADTSMVKGSYQAALRGVGGACAAVDRVMKGDVQNAFCALRPPGHHAERETAMGFCIFGNIAIAATHARRTYGLDRVAIVDFDVHHGNGTQDLVQGDEGILFVSSHQMPLYPGTGYPSEVGPHGTILNVALPAGSGRAAMEDSYREVVFPRLNAFKPQLVLISAGFDAHAADPLANLNWVEEDFAWLTRELCKIAATHAEGRVVSLLEGGYDLEALAASAAAHVSVLMEEGS